MIICILIFPIIQDHVAVIMLYKEYTSSLLVKETFSHYLCLSNLFIVSQHDIQIPIVDLSFSPVTLSLNTMVHMLTIKLTSSNYLLWRNQFVPLLASQELFGYLDGTIIAPCIMITYSNGIRKSNSAYNS